jgi:hypothetical protein
MVCPPATSEAEARWPRFGLVVVATTSRRDYLDQMIRPINCKFDDFGPIYLMVISKQNFKLLVKHSKYGRKLAGLFYFSTYHPNLV